MFWIILFFVVFTVGFVFGWSAHAWWNTKRRMRKALKMPKPTPTAAVHPKSFPWPRHDVVWVGNNRRVKVSIGQACITQMISAEAIPKDPKQSAELIDSVIKDLEQQLRKWIDEQPATRALAYLDPER